MRCNGAGAACVKIASATTATYLPTAEDVGSTLRFLVTATNPSGSAAASSPASTIVTAGPPMRQLGITTTGFTSVDVDSTTAEIGSQETASQSGTTVDAAFFARGAAHDQQFTPKIYILDGSDPTLLAAAPAVEVKAGTDGAWYAASLDGVKLVEGAQYILSVEPSGAADGTYLGVDTDGRPSLYVDYTTG
jgi:hypothetical protein